MRGWERWKRRQGGMEGECTEVNAWCFVETIMLKKVPFEEEHRKAKQED